MTKSRFWESQIISILKDCKSGAMNVPDFAENMALAK
jgi:hypothetical protein